MALLASIARGAAFVVSEETGRSRSRQQLRNMDFEIRSGALYALRGMKDPRSIRTLIQGLDDEKPELRYRALITRALITLAEILGNMRVTMHRACTSSIRIHNTISAFGNSGGPVDEGSKLYLRASSPNR